MSAKDVDDGTSRSSKEQEQHERCQDKWSFEPAKYVAWVFRDHALKVMGI